MPKPNTNVIILGSDDSDVINTDNDDQSHIQRSILRDLCRRDDNFKTPRRYLAEAQLPFVDQNIQVFTIEHVSSELEDHPCDPLTVDRVPPISVVTESMKELVKKNKEGNEEFNFIVQYASYGSFTQEGVRIPSRFDTLRRVKREVQEEARWLHGACGRLSSKEKETVTTLTIYHFPCELTFSTQQTGLGTCPDRITFHLPLFTTNSLRYIPWTHANDNLLALHYKSLNFTPPLHFDNATLNSLEHTFRLLDGQLANKLASIKHDISHLHTVTTSTLNDRLTYLALALTSLNTIIIGLLLPNSTSTDPTVL